MATAIRVEAPIGVDDEKIMSLETGKLAGLAGGAVLAGIGDTRILVTATAAGHVREGIDFFPLTVDIEERMYAAGKIPGSFFRREGRAPESAILTCRLIDRPLRPSFPSDFRNEVHIVGTVLGADQANPYDVLAINAASAALMISDIPFEGPIGAVRLAYNADGEWIAHPTYEESDESSFEIVVAGRELDSGDVAVMMVEAGGTEAAWGLYENGSPKVDEAALAASLEAAKAPIKAAIAAQRELLAGVVAAKGEIGTMDYTPQVDYSDDIYASVKDLGGERIVEIMQIADKAERTAAEGALRDELLERLVPNLVETAVAAGEPADVATTLATKHVKSAFRSLSKSTVRSRIVNEGARIDGRGLADLRPLSAEVGVLPTAHGTGLFQRGETQVLNVATLGMAKMDQMIDGIDPITRKRYLHHYNFPPFSTGEPGFMRGPKRREIGHGALAERAVFPVVPSLEEFPYTIRLVSEVLGSNGSSSMASVCASTLSLMDAGVPIKAPVAGIAMGLIYADDKYVTLTDILGAEDAYGDMDFKVAGTSEFITALQLDTKIDGIPSDVLASALNQAKEARLQILDVMASAIAAPRDEVAETAPKIISFEIPIDKIGEVIGPKGKVINAIQAETGANISVDDDGMVGTVAIAAVDSGAMAEAERQIKLILDPPTAEVGAEYDGRVVNITKFGAFVNILPGRDGLLHISKLGGGKRIDRVEDVVDLGDAVKVRVDDIDPNGKISLALVDDVSPKASEGGADGAAHSDAGAIDGADASETSGDRIEMNFAESFDAELTETFGDLGPAPVRSGGGNRGGDRNDRGGRGGSGGGRGGRGGGGGRGRR
ncbi:MAG: polyribonucleotide nucleotidyltransferase [Actinomycetota bacterium]|nr:polyribonucleotide nucleotidyltransferase [Actinomycetota bacterium]